jgi:hypothetical protein
VVGIGAAAGWTHQPGGAVDDKANAEGEWRFIAEGQKAKGSRLSEIGHANITPNPTYGGVTVREVCRHAWISFAGLERLRFGAPAEAATFARVALAALALAGGPVDVRAAVDVATLELRSDVGQRDSRVRAGRWRA